MKKKTILSYSCKTEPTPIESEQRNRHPQADSDREASAQFEH